VSRLDGDEQEEKGASEKHGMLLSLRKWAFAEKGDSGRRRIGQAPLPLHGPHCTWVSVYVHSTSRYKQSIQDPRDAAGAAPVARGPGFRGPPDCPVTTLAPTPHPRIKDRANGGERLRGRRSGPSPIAMTMTSWNTLRRSGGHPVGNRKDKWQHQDVMFNAGLTPGQGWMTRGRGRERQAGSF
jgi:hypothetical protein